MSEGARRAPFVTHTRKVDEALHLAASTFKIPIEKIDFDINVVSTSKKSHFEQSSLPIVLISEMDLRNENIKIIQSYNLTMRTIDKEKNELLPPLVFSANLSHTHAYLMIKAGTELNLDKISKSEMIEHFEKTIIKNSCLIRILEKINMTDIVNDIYSKHLGLQTNEEPIKVKIMDFPEPVDSVIDRLEKIYIKNQKEENKEGKDGHKIKKASIKRGENIFRYHHVTKGKNGRRYNGEIIKKQELSPKNIPKIITDKKTIEIIREKEWTDYRALESGYVNLEEGKLSVLYQADFLSANIRNQDKLVTSLDDGVSLNVKNNSALDDAVGSNTKMASDRINIKGNVGSGAEITGNKVFIGGQTHSTSTVIGQNVKIGTLKGHARADEIYIDILEHGKVWGENIKIKKAVGGEIKGRNIIIDTLDSNVKITASSNIVINHIVGGGNSLSLEPEASVDLDTKGDSVEDFLEKIDLVEHEILKDKKTLQEKEFKIKFNEKSLNTQREDKLDKLQFNINDNAIMSNKIKSHIETYKERDDIKDVIQKKEKKIFRLKKALKALSQSSKDAKIELRSIWSEGNSIKIFYDGKTYSYYPVRGEIKSPISYNTLKQENLI